MYVEIDAETLPPTLSLEAPDEFARLGVRVRIPRHVWLERDSLIALAGRAGDATWIEKLDGMLRYAADHGWIDDAGRVRAHVELVEPDEL